MSETSDDSLRRVFAQHPALPPEDDFVARVALQVAAQRRRQGRGRRVVGVLLALAALALAWGLAPFAPLAQDSLTMALLGLPEQQLRMPANPYLFMTILACVLPLAGTAWLVRRS